MTKGPPASPERKAEHLPPVAAMMYPAAQVDACIERLEATIARLQAELAIALGEAAPAVPGTTVADDEEPAAALTFERGPDPSGDSLGDFLDALHEPRPSAPRSPDGH